MLNTEYVYQFTDILQEPNMVKFFQYMENNKYITAQRELDQLFCLIYGEPYVIGTIRPFKVVLERDEA